LQDIYTGKIRNWKEAGGNDATITPYIRNINSGSQELFESLVLSFEQIPEDFRLWMESNSTVFTMAMVMNNIENNVNGLGYSVYYYQQNIIRDLMKVKTLAVNGISPNKKTIANWTYPYTSEVYAIIRSDLDKSSMAYKIYELLQTQDGKRAISESGYVPY
jgi:phosphate transport system substrate-binding protein